MNDEQAIEQQLQEKGLDAPRLTPELIDSVIVNAVYAVLPSGKGMVCELLLKNGFIVRGESSCVSIANFDVEIGKQISMEEARSKIWQLEAYLLHQKLYEENLQ